MRSAFRRKIRPRRERHNIKYILAELLVPVVLVSRDDLLNKTPQPTLSPDLFFTNEIEMRAFSKNFYTILPSTGLCNANCDNYIGTNLIAGIRDGRVIPGSGGGWSFTNLRKFNTLIDYPSNCKDEKVRDRYVGLARFFRAYFYFEKIRRFGDVPWHDTQLGSTDEALYKPRDSREYVMTKMLDDIDISVKKLRDRVGMPNLNLPDANANPDPYLASEVTGYADVSGDNNVVNYPCDNGKFDHDGEPTRDTHICIIPDYLLSCFKIPYNLTSMRLG